MRTIPIRSDGDVTRAVAIATRAARDACLEEAQVNAVATAASELARNIVKYAGAGQLSVRKVTDDAGIGVRIVASDRGPGIADVATALRDHYSTGGTLGLGLPGVKRLMDELVVESEPGKGTKITATSWVGDRRRAHRTASRPSGGFQTRHASTERLVAGEDGVDGVVAAATVRPHPTERVSGDSATLRWIDDRVLVAIVDALGHGPAAAAITQQAQAVLGSTRSTDVVTIMGAVHQALRTTAGAAVGLAVVDPAGRTFETAAVGNIRVRVVGASDRRLEWTAGTVGAQYRTPRVTRDVLGDATLLIYSDGVGDRFETRDYPGLRSDHPDIAAKIIVERFGKDHDDASCLVLRCPR